MTKRELINLLEASDAPDDTEVLRADYEYELLDLEESSLKIKTDAQRIWGWDGYVTKSGPFIVID